MTDPSAVIVGGGIGGLATAISLAGAGMTVTVLERGTALAEIGAGIAVWPNGVVCLERLGVGEALAGVAELGGTSVVRGVAGRPLSKADPAAFRERFGDMAVMHRSDLLSALAGRATEVGVELRCGEGVATVSATGEVSTTSGRTISADLVVGADGIGSAVRGSVFPGHPGPRGTGITAWRWVVDIDTCGLAEMPAPSTTLGMGMEFGILPLDSRRVYCFASSARRRDGSTPGPDAYRSWHAPVGALVEAGADVGMLRHEIADLPPLPTFVSGRVALVGDAAHAMTPHLGQGACQALEDAVVLGDMVTRHGRDIDAALAAYDRARVPRARAVQRASRLGMRATATPSRMFCGLRNLALRATPAAVTLSQLSRWVATDHLRDNGAAGPRTDPIPRGSGTG